MRRGEAVWGACKNGRNTARASLWFDYVKVANRRRTTEAALKALETGRVVLGYRRGRTETGIAGIVIFPSDFTVQRDPPIESVSSRTHAVRIPLELGPMPGVNSLVTKCNRKYRHADK